MHVFHEFSRTVLNPSRVSIHHLQIFYIPSTYRLSTPLSNVFTIYPAINHLCSIYLSVICVLSSIYLSSIYTCTWVMTVLAQQNTSQDHMLHCYYMINFLHFLCSEITITTHKLFVIIFISRMRKRKLREVK
jgi:hypothetical protein